MMISKRDFLKAAALAGPSTILGGLGLLHHETAEAQSSALTPAMVASLNFLLATEYLTAELYQQGMDTPGLVTDRDIFDLLRKHENGHVNSLKGILGSSARAKPAIDLSGGGRFQTLSNYSSFLEVADFLESLSVRTYLGEIDLLLSSPPILLTVLEIQETEAHHAARVAQLRGREPWSTDDAFDRPISRAEAVVAYAPFLAF